MWYRKRKGANELCTRLKETHRLKGRNLWLLGGRMWGRDSEGVWDEHVHAAIFKMDNQQGPTVEHMELCSTLGSSQLHPNTKKKVKKKKL